MVDDAVIEAVEAFGDHAAIGYIACRCYIDETNERIFTAEDLYKYYDQIADHNDHFVSRSEFADAHFSGRVTTKLYIHYDYWSFRRMLGDLITLGLLTRTAPGTQTYELVVDLDDTDSLLETLEANTSLSFPPDLR